MKPTIQLTTARRLTANVARRAGLLLCLTLLTSYTPVATRYSVPGKARIDDAAPALEIQGFHLVSVDEGWLLANQRLYWTKTGGQEWMDISPPSVGLFLIRAVFFLNTQTGWLVLSDADDAGDITYTLTRTSNGGDSWQAVPLRLFQPGDPDAWSGAVYVQFIDAQTGWLVVKRATSNNFSVGALFKTTDGGDTWTPLAIPIGEPVYFVTSKIGWTAGGADGDELYRTQDGGRAWQSYPINSLPANAHQRRLYRLPVFENAQAGVLPVLIADESGARIEFHLTDDGGRTWHLAASQALDSQPALGAGVPLAIFDAQNWMMVAPDDARLLGISNGGKTTKVISQDDMLSGISKLDMRTPGVGWARFISGSCASAPLTDDRRCVVETMLLRTDDGGRTWAALNLPQADTAPAPGDTLPSHPSTAGAASSQSLGSRTQTFVGHGFDSCHPPSLGLFQNWITNSPYRAWNLYIGGSNRGCNTENQAALTAAFILQLSQLGWKFIPTWVGPQAACTGFASHMSSDPAVAYNQGGSEANAAIQAANNLGLALADMSGTIIYYDLEGYDTTNTACRDAARAFISGWVAQLRARGNQAGVYGSGCASALSDFAGITNVPDVIWPAHWIYSAYNNQATVWNIACVSNTLWANHQRVRQYAGDHDETWGGASWNVDSNVLDGVVAVPVGSPPPTPTPTPTPTATSTPTPTATPGGCPTITAWKGEYWNNEILSGTPAACRNDADLNFGWLSGSPHPAVGSDHFSVRWTRQVNFTQGHYRFDLTHDDGARLYIDGALVFENWCSNCSVADSIVLPLTAGAHTIKYEAYDNLGWAAAGLSWQPVTPHYLPIVLHDH